MSQALLETDKELTTKLQELLVELQKRNESNNVRSFGTQRQLPQPERLISFDAREIQGIGHGAKFLGTTIKKGFDIADAAALFKAATTLVEESAEVTSDAGAAAAKAGINVP